MSPARLYDTQASMLLRAHDNCGATSMGQDVSADRAQEHSGEPAVTSITRWFRGLVSSCLLLLAAISRFHRRATRRRGR